MTTVHLMSPTPEAQKWRDLSPEEQKKELYIRIALAVGLVILLVGIAVACYFCCTTTSAACGPGDQIIERSNAIYCMRPGIFGGAGAIALAVLLKITNFEHEKNGLSDALQKEEAKRFGVHLQLTAGSLEDVHKEYAKGGLGPLVRCGMLTPAQGSRLRQVFDEYQQHKQTQTAFEGREASFVKAIQADPSSCAEYNTAREGITRLNSEWESLREQIKGN